MLSRSVDKLVEIFSPKQALVRQNARRVLKRYDGAQASRLTAHSVPKNQSADSELLGPWGADALRAWARKLVRDNAYAWGIVDTLTTAHIGNGIGAQSVYENPDGEETDEIELINDKRDQLWAEWCEVCDINGELTFEQIQRLADREIIESGEVLLHFVYTNTKTHKGIYRPVPVAIELIEADRLATDRDTYRSSRMREENVITRGVELDLHGKPVRYHVYPHHPNSPYSFLNQEPVALDARDVVHLFRKDRIGQTRGVTWFAPIMSWLRDLGLYVENEMQASAIAACFGVVITSEGVFEGLDPGTGEDSVDSRGNPLEYIEPGMVHRLGLGESIETVNPGRPNVNAGPWIELILRGLSVGVGLSYEAVSRDYSKVNYSSARTAQMEDRRKWRAWQQYLLRTMMQGTWDRFCDAAAMDGNPFFPTMDELLTDRRRVVPVEFSTPEWEWVDPTVEQQASANSIKDLQSTFQAELGARGRNWKSVFYQRAKEDRLKRKLQIGTVEEMQEQTKLQQAAMQTGQEAPLAAGTGEMSGLSRLQFKRNQKAIEDVLMGLEAGDISAAKAKVMLDALGVSPANVDALIADTIDMPEEEPASGSESIATK